MEAICGLPICPVTLGDLLSIYLYPGRRTTELVVTFAKYWPPMLAVAKLLGWGKSRLGITSSGGTCWGTAIIESGGTYCAFTMAFKGAPWTRVPRPAEILLWASLMLGCSLHIIIHYMFNNVSQLLLHMAHDDKYPHINLLFNWGCGHDHMLLHFNVVRLFGCNNWRGDLEQ